MENEVKVTYSAIIVLGNLMTKKGVLNGESTARMDVAIDHFFRYSVPFLITCGWAYRDDSEIEISEAMYQYAIASEQVPANSILKANESRDTVGDAIFSKQIVTSNSSWNKFLIVTSDYHVDRTREIFNFIYGNNYTIEVVGAITSQTPQQTASESKSLIAFRDTFDGILSGDDEAIYRRLGEEHPFYNGVIHPQI
ncbi:YdcF family protein [Mariniblastus sp.]|nr:YdcF family protein [Mariniblastus sp.]MDA7925826.1 YdcF family protein [Mariniblastus sp.]MDB4458658.1 YdcF family protein [bacterium]